MADRAPFASICRVIADLHDPHPTTQSDDTLPPSYDLAADQSADSHALIDWAAKTHLIAGHHARVLRRVVRSWTQQPAMVRRLTTALLDLFRVNRDGAAP